METIEFVSPEKVDLTNCDREAIHIPGYIQPHGVLLALQEPELIILQVSDNTSKFFGIPAESLINRKLSCLLTKSQIDKLKNCLWQENIEIHNPIKITIKSRNHYKEFESVIHRYNGVLILELEPCVYVDTLSSLSFYNLAKASIYNIKKASNFHEMTQLLAKEVRKITGFDRVMVYQFEPDDSGVVIGEDRQEELEPFLGLHYPASDIPKQARKLYYENWLRLIVDMNYQPVPIIPTNNPLTNSPLDLSFSVLRSVSPIHVEYLQNMGVSASLCISLINDKKLWGLIVCHHYSPKYVTYEIRKICEFIGQIISLEIVREEQQNYEKYGEKLKLIEGDLKNKLLACKHLTSNIFSDKQKSLLEFVNAQGAAVAFGEDITLFGKTPPIEDIRALIVWLERDCKQEIFYTNSFSQVYPEGKQIKDFASGLLAISIFVNHTSYHIIWLRPEVIQTVNWAGNPNKPVIVESNGSIRLSPRRSFELWKETVREKSLAWKQIEIDVALELRNALMLAVLGFYQSALQQAAIEAQAANRAKSQFLAKMTHELRTPLNAILGFTQVMTHNSSLNKEQQEYLGIIGRSGEHLLSLINDVLEMSKIEAGLVTLNENSFDLYHLLDDLEEMLQLKARLKGLKLLCDRSPDLPQYVKTDQSKLRQVLINLLANAIKFTEDGSLILRVKVVDHSRTFNSQLDTINCQLLFEVEDTGSGIAPEEIENLFKPFFQTETGRQSMEGTGLGLPISRQFVQLMGGDISISSKLGKGTIVRFDINVTSAITADIQTKKPTARPIALAPGQPIYRILVVEDSYENRQLLVKVLTSVGFEVREAENGKEAIALWSSWQPHLIWMDIQMPLMDGLEATKEIKKMLREREEVSEKTKSSFPAIVAITASAFEEDRDRILKAGCDDFVSKPFRSSEIFEKIAQHLGVRYLYEEETSRNSPQKQKILPAMSSRLTASDLSVMPAEWLAQVNHAAICADDELILELISQIPSAYEYLSNSLAELVNNFQFEVIAKLTLQ